MGIANKLHNFKNRLRTQGVLIGIKFYWKNLLFGEQIIFNTGRLILYLLRDCFNLRENRILKFFGPDTSFLSKINVGVDYFYNSCRRGEVIFLKHKAQDEKLYFLYKNKYQFVTDYSVGILIQIFCLKSYKFDDHLLKKDRKYCLFDLGMNKGFSSMWFAMNKKIDRIVGYEINPLLEKYIAENARMNKDLFDKIDINVFGLSNKNSKQTLYALKNDDGVSTINKDFYSQYWTNSRKVHVAKIQTNVKKASSEIKKYFDKLNSFHFILKIDVEGAEYEILEDLSRNSLIDSFDMILGEAHAGLDKAKKNMANFDFINIKKMSGNLITFVAIKK